MAPDAGGIGLAAECREDQEVMIVPVFQSKRATKKDSRRLRKKNYKFAARRGQSVLSVLVPGIGMRICWQGTWKAACEQALERMQCASYPLR